MLKAPQASIAGDSDQVAVVIPAYNEAGSIVALVNRALQHVPLVIVVDDASQDETATLLTDTPVVLLRHGVNLGKGAALASGFREALARGVSAVVTLDGDGQHRPEDIPRFLARSRQCPGRIVIGSRAMDRDAFPWSRYAANRVADFWISWAAGHNIDDSQSGFRLYPRAVLEAVTANSRRRFVFESEVLIDAVRRGALTEALPIPALYGGEILRPSHFRPIIDIASIVKMVAWKLLCRGMYLQGLYAMYRDRRLARKVAASSMVEGALAQENRGLPLEQKNAGPAE